MKETTPIKRIFILIPVGLAAAALFGWLVHVVLVAAGVSEPAATTVYGPTTQRFWATTVMLLALVGLGTGGLALFRSARRIGNGGRRGAIVVLVVGLVAVVVGGLLLAIANGGPGTGNGVVGAAAALVLGLIDMAIGGLVLSRSRRTD